MPQEQQGNKLTLIYEKLGVVLPDQLLDIRCRWPMLRLPHLAVPHHAPWLPSFLAMVGAPSSYDKVSHIPGPSHAFARALSMPRPCPCLHPVHALGLSTSPSMDHLYLNLWVWSTCEVITCI